MKNKVKRILIILAFLPGFSSLTAQSPGGEASNLVFWLKADAGTSTTTNGASVAQWNDQSGNGNDAEDSGQDPLFLQVGDSYNPAIDFSAVSGGMKMKDEDDINKKSSPQKTIIMAFKTGSSVNTTQMLFEQGGEKKGINIYIDGGNLYCNFIDNNSNNASSTAISTYTSYVLIFVYDGNNTDWDAYLNGTWAFGDNSTPSSWPGNKDDIGIGRVVGNTQYHNNGNSSGPDSFLGQIMEMAYYNNDAFDAGERDNMFSYLGIKYGITLNQDYNLAAGGTKFWDQSTNATYHNDIAGMIRDDISGMHQKQGKSASADALLTVARTAVAVDNASNANTLANDEEYMVWGNNNGSVSFSTTGAPAGYSKLGRAWKGETSTNFIGIEMQYPDNSSSASTKLPAEQNGVYLLADTDDDFTSGALALQMTQVGSNWSLSASTSTSYQYFTVATGELDAVLSVTTQGSETGPVNIVYTVTLSATNITGSAITFDLADLGTGTATSGSDYNAIPGAAQISVANGASTGTYTVTVIDDGSVESSETLDLQISNPSPSWVSISTASATASIADDDVLGGPAGVTSNLIFWLKADAGTNTTANGGTITDWLDQTSNGNDAYDVSGTDPTFLQVGDGYYPAIDFSSGSGGLSMNNSNDINTSASSQKSLVIAFKTGSDVNTRQLIYEEGGGTNGLNLYIDGGNLFSNLWVSNADNAASTSIAASTSYVVVFVYDGNNTRWDTYVNGSLAMSDASSPNSLPAHSGAVGIGVIESSTQYDGAIDVSSGEGFLGQIMEMAYYNNEALDASERKDLFSYLGHKYDITIGHDYEVAAPGSTIFWDYSANSGYNSGIAGIGRDDGSGLHKKQGKSSEATGLVVFGSGSITADNASNPSSIGSDETFILWGHNGGNVTYTTSGAPAGAAVLDRKWKYQETGSIGSIILQVPDNSSGAATTLPAEQNNIYILADADGDFSSGAIQAPMTANGTNWELSSSGTSALQYFTFATDRLGAALSVTTQGQELGPVDIVYTVTLSATNNTGSTITFDLDDAGTGNATSGSDYTAIPGAATISVANGASTGTYTVAVTNDVDIEGPETVDLVISNPSAGMVEITSAAATASIDDDDDDFGPGGVTTNLNVWLRPDVGTSTTTDNTALTTWTDQSVNGNNGTSDGNPPTFKDNLADNFNFNPTVDFDGSNDRLVVNLSAIKSGAGNGDYSLFAVGERDNNSFNIVLGSEGGSGNQDLHFGYRSSNNATIAHWGNDLDVTGLNNYNTPAVTPYLLSAVYNGSTRVIEEHRDGSFSRASGNNTTDLSGSKTNYIGDLQSVGNYNGRITEVIVFDNDLSNLEKVRVYSYLGVKYGIDLTNNLDGDGNLNEVISGAIREGDYVAADGSTVIWNYATQGAAYFNDIAGIGRDDRSNLAQKQSKSENQGTVLTIGLGSIAASNFANGNSFATDASYLLWGHNDGTLAGEATNAALPAQSGMADKMKRQWQIVENGSVGTVQVAFPKASIDPAFTYGSYGTLYLRVADNAALTSNPVDVALSTATINGTLSYVADHDFNGTKFFGIIQKDIVLWTGLEWRGGLSAATAHAPSENTLDSTKALYILNGDTANLLEAAQLSSVDIALSATLTVKPSFCLKTSSIANAGNLLFEADATGFSQYNGPAVQATFEQYVDNEGWHQIGSPFSDATWNSFTFKNENGFINHPIGGSSLDSCNYCNLWWYDPSVDNGTDIGFMASTAYGTWRTSTDGSQAFDATKGWNLYLDAAQNFGSAPWTLSVSGTINSGNVTQVVNENNSGWNLMANPYPSVIDWDKVDNGLAAEGIAPGYHVWDEVNTNFATYATGVGTLGANQYIAPMQGFYVQTTVVSAQGGSDVYHNFNLTNADRPNDCAGGSGIFFRTTGSGDKIVLRTTHHSSGKYDETIVRFADKAQRGFEPKEDIRKLFTTYQDVPSVYARFGSSFTAISAMPWPTLRDSVNIGIQTADKSSVTIELLDRPQGMFIYLEDIKTGNWYLLDKAHEFVADDAYRDRFVLHYSYEPLELEVGVLNPFTIHIRDGELVITTEKRVREGEWYLSSVSGAVVMKGRIAPDSGQHHTASLAGLRAGVYVFVLFVNKEKYTEKLPVVNLH